MLGYLLKHDFLLKRSIHTFTSKALTNNCILGNQGGCYWKDVGVLHLRLYHVTLPVSQPEKQVTHSKAKTEVSFAKKVTKAGKDVTYTGVIVLGLAVTGAIFFMIGRELMSRNSPSVIFGNALSLCKNNPEVDEALGGSIKGRGEMNSRGRSRHVSHAEYEKEGVKYMRLKFYLIGSIRRGTASLEVKQNESGNYEVRYLFVEVDTYPSRTIIVVDNR